MKKKVVDPPAIMQSRSYSGFSHIMVAMVKKEVGGHPTFLLHWWKKTWRTPSTYVNWQGFPFLAQAVVTASINANGVLFKVFLSHFCSGEEGAFMHMGFYSGFSHLVSRLQWWRRIWWIPAFMQQGFLLWVFPAHGLAVVVKEVVDPQPLSVWVFILGFPILCAGCGSEEGSGGHPAWP